MIGNIQRASESEIRQTFIVILHLSAAASSTGPYSCIHNLDPDCGPPLSRHGAEEIQWPSPGLFDERDDGSTNAVRHSASQAGGGGYKSCKGTLSDVVFGAYLGRPARHNPRSETILIHLHIARRLTTKLES